MNPISRIRFELEQKRFHFIVTALTKPKSKQSSAATSCLAPPKVEAWVALLLLHLITKSPDKFSQRDLWVNHVVMTESDERKDDILQVFSPMSSTCFTWSSWSSCSQLSDRHCFKTASSPPAGSHQQLKCLWTFWGCSISLTPEWQHQGQSKDLTFAIFFSLPSLDLLSLDFRQGRKLDGGQPEVGAEWRVETQ